MPRPAPARAVLRKLRSRFSRPRWAHLATSRRLQLFCCRCSCINLFRSESGNNVGAADFLYVKAPLAQLLNYFGAFQSSRLDDGCKFHLQPIGANAMFVNKLL